MNQELGSMIALLDRVQMNAADRAAATATLHRAEALAETLYRAIKAVQVVTEWSGHGARVLARRVRARFA
jgi:hypothetical protein